MSSINAVMQIAYLHHKSCAQNFPLNELDDRIYWEYMPLFTASATKQFWASDNRGLILGLL